MESTLDPQRLAALLDGRLDARERAELLAQLAMSEEDFEVFAEAVATTADLRTDAPVLNADEDEAADPVASAGGANSLVESRAAAPADAGPITAGDEAAPLPGTELRVVAPAPALESESARRDVIPLRPRTPVWRRPGVAVAMAAVLAGAVLAPWALSRGRAPGHPGEVAGLLSAPGAGLPADWQTPVWSVTRGAGDAAGDEARAARIGARLVDLEVAVRARDAAATDLAALQVSSMLSDVTAGGPAAAQVEQVGRMAGEPPEQVLPVLRQAQEAALVAGEDALTRGAWAEAARLAAARRDGAFFRAGATRRLLREAQGDAALAPEARAAVGRIRRALEGEGALEWQALQRESSELLRVLAS